MGFELTNNEGTTYSVHAIPEGLEGIDILSLLREMLAGVQELDVITVKQEINDNLSLVMARAAAIPYGQVLSNLEMEDLVNNLFQCDNVNYTPDGKTVICILKQIDIEQMFV